MNEDRTGAWFSHYLNSLKHHEGVDPKSEGLIWIDCFQIEGPFYPDQRSFFDTLLCPEEPSPEMPSQMVWNDSNAAVHRWIVADAKRSTLQSERELWGMIPPRGAARPEVKQPLLAANPGIRGQGKVSVGG